jgi:hypothetical protein
MVINPIFTVALHPIYGPAFQPPSPPAMGMGQPYPSPARWGGGGGCGGGCVVPGGVVYV